MSGSAVRRRGEGSIQQRKDGSWAFVVDLGRDSNGLRVRRTIYAKTQPELLRKAEDERARGFAGASKKPYDRIETILRICEMVRSGHDTASPELQKELAYQRFHESRKQTPPPVSKRSVRTWRRK